MKMLEKESEGVKISEAEAQLYDRQVGTKHQQMR